MAPTKTTIKTRVFMPGDNKRPVLTVKRAVTVAEAVKLGREAVAAAIAAMQEALRQPDDEWSAIVDARAAASEVTLNDLTGAVTIEPDEDAEDDGE